MTKTENINKGRIWADLKDMWRVFGEILPLQKSNDKSILSIKKHRKLRKVCALPLIVAEVLLCFDPFVWIFRMVFGGIWGGVEVF